LKTSFIIFLVNLTAWQSFCQGDQAIAKANLPQNVIQNRITEKLNSENKNILPLFGEIEKTPAEKALDHSFIEMCKKNFPNLNEASKFFADRGWEYISEAELDTAQYRFNLCYLLNPHNLDAYWGSGVICYQKEEYDLASHLLKKGLEIDSTNSSLIVDLATVELSCFEKTNHEQDLTLAHSYLAKAIDIDPTNVLAWLKRSETEYHLENYENAWDCIHSARLLDLGKVDLQFVEKLSTKMKDPKEVFKF
jgi:tetratricopeptide (TPR) repeat protein